MPTKMKSFRFSEAELNNLQFIADSFDMDHKDVVSLLLEYAASRLSDFSESDGDYVPDLIKHLAFSRWGYAYLVCLDRLHS